MKPSEVDLMSFRSIVNHAVSVGMAVPIPWCSEHRAPFEDEAIHSKTVCGYAFWADRAGETFEFPCQEEPQQVYRIPPPSPEPN